MHKNKNSLLSSTCFLLSFSFSSVSLQAMDLNDSSSKSAEKSTPGNTLTLVTAPSSSPSSAVKQLAAEQAELEKKYPLTQKGNASLIWAANRGDEAAQDEMMRRYAYNYAYFSDKIINLQKHDLKKFWAFSNIENKLITKLGYVLALSFLEKELVEKLPTLIGKIEAEALNGNVEAQYNLGSIYNRGLGAVEYDDLKSFQWYIKAAEQGMIQAQFCVGRDYNYGDVDILEIEEENKTQEMLKWYEKAAEQGHVGAKESLYRHFSCLAEDGYTMAQIRVSEMYENGQGVEKDQKKAAYWRLRAREDQENSDDQYTLGNMYFYEFWNKKKAIECYTKAAEQNHVEAQLILGSLYLKGEGLEKNIQEAIKWYARAAEQNNVEAQFILGSLYLKGEELEKNIQEAVKWYARAAEQNNVEAQFILGGLYLKGEGLEQNIQEAVKWYARAAEQNNVEAQFILGNLYYKGEKLEKNIQEALKWIMKAAEHNHIEAQNILSQMYAEGQGMEKDEKKASYWRSRALAEQGHVEALKKAGQNRYIYPYPLDEYQQKARVRGEPEQIETQRRLSQMYLEEQGVERDEQKARFWSVSAQALEGDPEAQMRLGDMYAEGQGVIKNNERALKWYEEAKAVVIEEGDQYIAYLGEVYYRLSKMYLKGLGTKIDLAEAQNLYRGAIRRGCDENRQLLKSICKKLEEEGALWEIDKPEISFWKYRLRAVQGEIEFQSKLAHCYLNGWGVKKNEQQALKWYTRAAEQGDAGAQVSLGNMYKNGLGVEKDEKKAVGLYTQAAEQGDAQAQVSLGNMYKNGLGVEKDEKKAAKLYKKAATQDNTEAKYNLGTLYENGLGVGKDEKKAADLYTQAAEQENAAAQYSLGVMYLEGRGVEENEELGAEWIEEANKRGCAEATHHLGGLYFEGLGIEKDKRKALELLIQAAEKGNRESQETLSQMYKTGQYVEKDEKKSTYWSTRVKATEGDPSSQNSLGCLYAKGEGVTKNDQLAFSWMLKSAEQGLAQAQTNVGYMYENGRGISSDSRKAMEWHTKAAEQGDSGAQKILGDMCLNKGYYSGSREKAFEWYTKSATQGNAEAQNALGEMYSKGEGVTKDNVKALEWYTRAAEQENADAQYKLGKFYQKGENIVQNTAEAIKWLLLSKKLTNPPANSWAQRDDSLDFVKRFLPLNPRAEHASTKEAAAIFSSKLDSLVKSFDLLQTGNEVRIRLHDSTSHFKEASVAIPGFMEAYQELFNITSKLDSGLRILKETKPGFMMTIFSPTDEFLNSLPQAITTQMFSLDKFEDANYLTIGVENCKIVKKFLKVYPDLLTALNSAHGILRNLRKPYDSLATLKQAQLVKLNCELREILKELSREDQNNEIKETLNQRKASLEQEFKEELNKPEEKLPLKVKEDLDHLEEIEEAFRISDEFLKGFIRHGRAVRNEEFLELHPFLK